MNKLPEKGQEVSLKEIELKLNKCLVCSKSKAASPKECLFDCEVKLRKARSKSWKNILQL